MTCRRDDDLPYERDSTHPLTSGAGAPIGREEPRDDAAHDGGEQNRRPGPDEVPERVRDDEAGTEDEDGEGSANGARGPPPPEPAPGGGRHEDDAAEPAKARSLRDREPEHERHGGTQ